MGEANFPKRSVQLSNCCISSFVLYSHSFSIFSFFLPCLSWALEVPDNAQCPVKVLARDAATKGWRCGEQRFLRCRGEKRKDFKQDSSTFVFQKFRYVGSDMENRYEDEGLVTFQKMLRTWLDWG